MSGPVMKPEPRMSAVSTPTAPKPVGERLVKVMLYRDYPGDLNATTVLMSRTEADSLQAEYRKNGTANNVLTFKGKAENGPLEEFDFERSYIRGIEVMPHE
jgi:hypothetical protein